VKGPPRKEQKAGYERSSPYDTLIIKAWWKEPGLQQQRTERIDKRLK
jgi:hypothetical protein